MEKLQPERVFYYFEKLSAVPRGSGNMKGIADFCEAFAKLQSLEYVRDKMDNVIIYKPATAGKENLEPVILQGHLDMVCQKTADSNFNFEKDGIKLLIDGDFVKAEGTTLGADNGIAVAMILAILESNSISHPAIEAVFTTDEETGMFGAKDLDISLLKGRRMINLDSEEDDSLTISCAGGIELDVSFDLKTVKKTGSLVEVVIKGLKGGHSGVEIGANRVNASCLAGRFLNKMSKLEEFDIISVDGGEKANAIPNNSHIKLLVENADSFTKNAKAYLDIIKEEISFREKDFAPEIKVLDNGEFEVFEENLKTAIINSLACTPNGVLEMSAEINNLVETSLNLGIVATTSDKITFIHSIRSNKASAIEFVSEKMEAFYSDKPCLTKTDGYYPPWEYKENSPLRELYVKAYGEHFDKEVKVEALHAGLECAVFASRIKDLDCIAIGPSMFDVHTVKEKLSISSVQKFFALLLKILEKIC